MTECRREKFLERTPHQSTQGLSEISDKLLLLRSTMSSISIESLSVLSSDYEYCDKIGSGKFGSVYKVVYKETGTHFVHCSGISSGKA